jgi:hypothetical protein
VAASKKKLFILMLPHYKKQQHMMATTIEPAYAAQPTSDNNKNNDGSGIVAQGGNDTTIADDANAQDQVAHRQEVWEAVVKLLHVNETIVEKLQTAGISCMDDVQQVFFGQDSTSPLSSSQNNALQQNLSFLQLQKLRVIATYLLSNDDKLIESTPLGKMARTNSHCSELGTLVKRGRPRKLLLSSMEMPAKRPRGRPRKHLVKRPRGRPRKSVENTAETPKKRPPKCSLESGEVPAKRPRGRPRKESVEGHVKRPRGRPRKESVEGHVKRPRGRPRKDPLKSVEGHVQLLEGHPQKHPFESLDMKTPALGPIGHAIIQTVEAMTPLEVRSPSLPKLDHEEMDL